MLAVLEGKLLAGSVFCGKNRFLLSSRIWDKDCLFEGFFITKT